MILGRKEKKDEKNLKFYSQSETVKVKLEKHCFLWLTESMTHKCAKTESEFQTKLKAII